MGFFSRNDDKAADERKADRDAYRSAKQAQQNYRNKDRNEDATYRQHNALTEETHKNVSWWAR